LRRLVDAAERLSGARAPAPVLRAALSVSPRNSRGASTPSPAASAASRRFSGDSRSTTRKPKSRAARSGARSLANRRFSASMPRLEETTSKRRARW
jgi:hypothetical protein